MMCSETTRPVTRPVTRCGASESANFVTFPLINSLSDTTGAYAWTWARASTKNDFDDAGVLQSYAANEPAYGPGGRAGFHGGFTNSISAARYRDFTGWTVVNGTVDADSITAIDGTTRTTNTFTATSANATLFQGAITAGSAKHAGAVMVKAKVGTSVEVSNDGGSTWSAFTINSSAWVKCWHAPTVANPDFGIRLANSGDAIHIDWALSCLNKKYPFVMVEGGASTLADAVSMTDKIVNDTSSAFVYEFQAEQFEGSTKRILIADGLVSIGSHFHGSGTVVYGHFGNGNFSAANNGLTSTPISFGVSRLDSETHLSSNIQTLTVAEGDLTGTFVAWYLGADQNSNNSANGYISNLTFYKTGMDASALQAAKP